MKRFKMLFNFIVMQLKYKVTHTPDIVKVCLQAQMTKSMRKMEALCHFSSGKKNASRNRNELNCFFNGRKETWLCNTPISSNVFSSINMEIIFDHFREGILIDFFPSRLSTIFLHAVEMTLKNSRIASSITWSITSSFKIDFCLFLVLYHTHTSSTKNFRPSFFRAQNLIHK